ncbi:variable surface protein [Plasmodium gonderi]|uniref:Variable surface protein n=1 Tax=Plasmodium gonderi TaxID=77519 RepID=A0A1Y1JNU4_PLAGO|nr:variable surface protein [Plasmodium gonderi]GAW83930.1 variable surface protein [Plasmodium gonderi]
MREKELAKEKKWEIKKKREDDVKKVMHIKYVFCVILLCLIQLCGIIISVLDLIKFMEDSSNFVVSILKYQKFYTLDSYIYVTFFLILSSLILASIIYIMTKIVKYERIKANSIKMNFKEYYIFCKEVLTK